MKRYPVATICPTCLTLVSQTEGVDLATVPIKTVAMLRQTHRGSTVTVLRAGWHLGDGRVTKCRKRAGPWALTERYPDRRKICFECCERDRWEQEKVPNSLAALGAGGCWSVLLDADVADETLLSFLRDAPGLFAARRAERAIESRDDEQYGQELRELFRRGQPVSQAGRYLDQLAPDVVVTDEASLTSGDAPLQWRPVMNPVSFVAHWTPEAENALRAKALRERWDREAKANLPRRQHAETDRGGLVTKHAGHLASDCSQSR